MSKRYGMVIDLKRCINCHACTVACKIENGISQGAWNRVETVGGQQLDTASGKYPNLNMVFIPRLCVHCQNAPCVETCPTGASYKRDDGIVLVDYDKCVGCGYCILACPYDARSINKEGSNYFAPEGVGEGRSEYQRHKSGATEKCILCVHKVEKGEEPACVAACAQNARHFGDLNDPQSAVSRMIALKHAVALLKELGTEPSVFYITP